MSVKNRWILVTLLIAGSLLLFSLFTKSNEATINVEISEAPNTKTLEPTSETANLPKEVPDAVTEKSESPTTERFESLKQKIARFPKTVTADYKNQVAADPHHTPPVVIQTATQLFNILQAVKNEGDAKEAFVFFTNCVNSGPDDVVAVQTACYRHARSLATNYPALESDFKKLAQNAPENVLRIVQMDAVE